MRILWALILLLVGCQEPFSNEDILFLKAVPRNLEIDVPDEADRTMRSLRPAQETPAGAAEFYVEMVRTSTEVNGGIFEILKMVEAVTAFPATVRQIDPDENIDRRAWGPFQPDEEPNEILLVIDRIHVETGTVIRFTAESDPIEVDSFFQYSFNLRRIGEERFSPVITGTTILLEANEEEATGDLCLNFDEIARFEMNQEEEPATGIFCVGYDFRGEGELIELTAEANATKSDLFANPDARFTYERRPDDSGRFNFNYRADAFGSPAPETYNVLVRWVPDLAGRADVEVCDGDVGVSSLYAIECWNQFFVRTFLLSNIPGEPTFGTISNCEESLRGDPIDAGPGCDN